MEKAYTEEIKQFGLVVKKLREERGHTQQDLADRCEVDIRTIQRIEKGEYGIGLHIVIGLAVAFELKPWELMKDIKVTIRKR